MRLTDCMRQVRTPALREGLRDVEKALMSSRAISFDMQKAHGIVGAIHKFQELASQGLEGSANIQLEQMMQLVRADVVKKERWYMGILDALRGGRRGVPSKPGAPRASDADGSAVAIQEKIEELIAVLKYQYARRDSMVARMKAMSPESQEYKSIYTDLVMLLDEIEVTEKAIDSYRNTLLENHQYKLVVDAKKRAEDLAKHAVNVPMAEVLVEEVATKEEDLEAHAQDIQSVFGSRASAQRSAPAPQPIDPRIAAMLDVQPATPPVPSPSPGEVAAAEAVIPEGVALDIDITAAPVPTESPEGREEIEPLL